MGAIADHPVRASLLTQLPEICGHYSAYGEVNVYLAEISINGLADVQSRICEVSNILIDEGGTLPGPNLVLKV